MKKFAFTAISIILLVVVFIVYRKVNSGVISISDKNVIKITISVDGADKLLRVTEDKDTIRDIVHHMNGLHLERTKKNADEYDGSSFVIKVYFDDNSINEYIEFGNMFFREAGKEWYSIPYEEADKFGGFYKVLSE